MADIRVVFLLLFCFHYGSSYIIASEKKLKLPINYHFKGESSDLVSGIVQPFEAWRSAEKDKTRVDIYGGLVKSYYEVKNEELHTEYMIHPITTEEDLNKLKCDKNYVSEQPQVLPASDNFTYSGEEIYNEKPVQVWKFLQISEGKKTEDTIYAYAIQDGVDIPVWREKKIHNEWTGATSDHVISSYSGYKSPDDKDLDAAQAPECEDAVLVSKDSHVDNIFHGYKLKQGRKYRNNEHEMRKLIFKQNLKRVTKHNKKNLSYKLTINKFSDRTEDELAHLKGSRPSDPLAVGSVPFPHSEEEVDHLVKSLPDNYDMRIDGVISVIKNQADCGSCWSFATVAAIEGALARKNGVRFLDLSEQSLVDCSWGYKNLGCNGGFPKLAYKYVLQHGIPTEKDYGGYLAADGYCHLKNMSDLYHIKGFARVPPLSVNAMKVALYKYGPVTVTINSDLIVDYASGIFYNHKCSRKRINHAVTVVGYGIRNGTEYWIVKNTWGEDWGQDGYVLFSAFNNVCHILEDAFYPIV